MKRLILFIPILLLPLVLNAQSPSIRHMFRSYDPGKEVVRVHVPGFIMRVASWFVDDYEAKYVLKNLGSIYVMASNDQVDSFDTEFAQDISRRLKKRNFEEMMAVTDDGETVDILVRELGKRKKKKEFVIAVDSDEDVLVYVRSKVDLEKLISHGDFNISGVKLKELIK